MIGRIIIRITGTLVALALLGWLGLAIYNKVSEQRQPMDGRSGEAAVAVQTAAVERGMIRDYRTFTGTLTARAQFTVAPKIAGRINRLYVDIGDIVEQDQIIAELDDAEFVQQVEQARAELAVAEASLEEARSELASAEREFDRVESLRVQGIASESELDAARLQFDGQRARFKVAEAQVSQRQAALRAAEVRMGYTKVRASWRGDDVHRVVGERFADEGDTLAANAPLVSVLNIATLRAIIFATERDYPRLAVGQRAEVRAEAFTEEIFTGEVARLAPQFREASRLARIELRVPNDDGRLKPGMFVRVRLKLAEIADAITIPLDALVRRRNEAGVFLADLEHRTAQFVPVRVGVTEGDRVQVIEPDLAGHVITLGQHLLEDGSAITLVDSETPVEEALAESPREGV